MPRTSFDPRVHGFAFPNRWTLEDEERQQLDRIFVDYFTRRDFLGPVGDLVIPLGVRALRKQLESHLSPGYGLCGGMCFVALDHYMAGLPLPRGQNADDHPAPVSHLRTAIWERQLDSLVSDASRFLAWLVTLNYIPSAWPLQGGAAWLLAHSMEEWRRLKASVDVGRPVPIGLVRDTKHVYDNHQVLATGYDQADGTHGTIYLYDPNCPDQESTIRVEFGPLLLNGQESCGALAPLRGFFCETYIPRDPIG